MKNSAHKKKGKKEVEEKCRCREVHNEDTRQIKSPNFLHAHLIQWQELLAVTEINWVGM